MTNTSFEIDTPPEDDADKYSHVALNRKVLTVLRVIIAFLSVLSVSLVIFLRGTTMKAKRLDNEVTSLRSVNKQVYDWIMASIENPSGKDWPSRLNDVDNSFAHAGTIEERTDSSFRKISEIIKQLKIEVSGQDLQQNRQSQRTSADLLSGRSERVRGLLVNAEHLIRGEINSVEREVTAIDRKEAEVALLSLSGISVLIVFLVVAFYRQTHLFTESEKGLKLFRQTVRNSTTGIAIIEIRKRIEKNEFIIIERNKAVEAITGLPSAKTLGKDLATIVKGINPKRLLDALVRVNETKTPLDLGEEYIDYWVGIPGWISTKLFPVYKNTVGILLEPRTEKKKMELALRESEERWQLVVWGADDGIWDWNIANNSIFYSDRWYTMTGYDLYDVMNHLANPEEYVHPDDAIAVKSRLYDYLERKISPFSVEYRIRMKQGGYKWVHDRGQAVFDTDGKPLRMAGSTSDIDFRKRMEIESLETQKLLGSVIENAPNAITLRNAKDYTFITANRMAGKMFGVDHEDMMKKRFDDLVSEVDVIRFEMLDKLAIRTGKIVEDISEVYLPMRKEKLHIFSKSICLFDEAGNPAHILTNFEDMTPRLKQQNERERLREQLQVRNDELEKALREMKEIQRGLVQSEKLASIGQLVAGVAHEINNPLAFVCSNLNRFDEYFHEIVTLNGEWSALGGVTEKNGDFCNALKRAEKHEKEADVNSLVDDFEILMEHTRGGAERIKKIVEQLRGFTRLSDNSFSEADLNAALDDTLSIVWNEIKYKATVKKEYGKIPPVACNLGEIKQVFVNLLVNAAQAISEKGEIAVRTGVEDSNVFVDIVDTGGGISQENLTKIFDPFFTTKPVGKGTGLGLWVSATIIQKHAGTINVESELGKGTKMTVTIPIDSKV